MEQSKDRSIPQFKRLLRVNNVARRTGLPERTIRHWAAIGRIPARRLGQKLWVFEPNDLDVIIRQRRAHV